MVKLKPTAGYLLIEPLGAETKTSSGIYIPDVHSEKPQKGKVIAVGPGTEPIKVGDIVVHKKWGGNEIKLEGKEYLFARIEDILGTEV